MTSVLVVEDDARIASFLERGLKAEGFGVTLARSGEEALAMARSSEFGIVVLDLMLPRMGGLEVCQRLRETGSEAFVLMLTAKDRLQDKLDGLAGGADDYLTKPFAFDELMARLRAFERRAAAKGDGPLLEAGDLRLDLDAKTAWRGDRRIDFTAKEFALLAFLLRHQGSVVSRARLLSNVWNLSFDPGTKVVDVYIRYLRRKLAQGGESSMIRTVRGFGFTID
jgi:two-component system OmpR family response regulator